MFLVLNSSLIYLSHSLMEKMHPYCIWSQTLCSHAIIVVNGIVVKRHQVLLPQNPIELSTTIPPLIRVQLPRYYWESKQSFLKNKDVLTIILEKAMAPHSSTFAWKIPWAEEPGGLQSMGLWRVGHDWATSLSLFTFMHWRRKWQPTPAFLPGESQGQGSLVGCRLWGRTELDTTEVT